MDSDKISTNVQLILRPAGLLIAAAIAFFAPPALSQTAVEENIEAELKRLKASPGALDAEVPVVRIFELWDSAGPKKVVEALTRIDEQSVVLARLITAASRESQLWITTHSRALADRVAEFSGEEPVRLTMVEGETRIA